MELIPLTESMFEVIGPVLATFQTPPPRDPIWQNLLNPPWPIAESHRGFALMDKGRAVGFIGTVFSRRVIDGRIEKFCNVTLEDYRHESMALIKPLLGLKDYTITNLTPTPPVHALFTRLGFQELDQTLHILLPIPSLNRPRSACPSRYRMLTRPEDIAGLLNAPDAAIFRDHQLKHCRHLLIAGQNDYCYVVFTRTRGRRHSFSLVHYLSDPSIFFGNLNRAKLTMDLMSKTPFIMLMDRYVNGLRLGFVRTTAIRHPALFKSSTLKREQIDTLYSELILLNL
jgi:hypothetical protein